MDNKNNANDYGIVDLFKQPENKTKNTKNQNDNNQTKSSNSDTSSSSSFDVVKDFSYRTMHSTFFGKNNPANKKLSQFEKNSFVQNIIDNGVLPDSSNIYLPPKSTKNMETWKKIIVTEDNFNEVMDILNEYKKQHPQFGMAFDYEIWQTYNIPKYIIDYFIAKYNINIPVPEYDENTMRYNRRQYDEEYRTYQNKVLREILTYEPNIDKYILKEPNYHIEQDDLINFQINALFLNIVGWYYGLKMPYDAIEAITRLLQDKINVLKDGWFKTWLNSTNQNNELILQSLNNKTNDAILGSNLNTFFNQTLNIKTSEFLTDDINNPNENLLNYFKLNLNKDKITPDFYLVLANFLNEKNLKGDDASAIIHEIPMLNYAIEKRRFNNFITKWNSVHPKIEHFDLYEKYKKYESTMFLNDGQTNTDYLIFIKLIDDMINESVQFVNYIKSGSDNFWYPFFMCSFGIDGYMFTFIENQYLNNADLWDTDNNLELIDNASLQSINNKQTSFSSSYLNNINSLKFFANKCNAGSFINYFYLVCIANGVFFYGVNSGDYDDGLMKSWLLYEDPWKFSLLNITSPNPSIKQGGRVDITFTYKNKDINSYYRNATYLSLFFPFVHLYGDRKFETPLINGGEQRHIDCIKESAGGATDEDFGKGLKEVESNHKSSVESNKGLPFSAKLPSEITLTNFKDTLLYNWYDVFNTAVTYANIYKAKQQLAKNAAINLGGQGSDLFDTKDRTVAMLLFMDEALKDGLLANNIKESKLHLEDLNQDYFNYALKDKNPIYLIFLKPYEDALLNGTFTLEQLEPLGINYYLKDFADKNIDEKTRERNRSLNFKNALIGIVYRTSYWYRNNKPGKHRDIYPEFSALNKAHRYIDNFNFNLNDRYDKTFSKWTNQAKENAMVELTKNDLVRIDVRDRVISGISLRNDGLKTFIDNIITNMTSFKPTNNDLINYQNMVKLIVKVYDAFQKSDMSVLIEQTKLRQTIIYEKTSNGQLVQVAALNGIYLSSFNPLWKPEFKLNDVDYDDLSKSKQKIYTNDTEHPLYQRIKYLFKIDTRKQAHLKDISNQTENDKPVNDPNLDDFLAFYFDTIIKIDPKDRDDQQYQDVINFFNSHLIYHSKPWELMDRDRMNNATYYNKTGLNYPTWSRIWYNVALKEGIKFVIDNKEFTIPFDEFKNVSNWEVRTRREFVGNVLNEQYYPYLVFHYKGYEIELNGLSLKWHQNKDGDLKDESSLIAPSSLISIEPDEVKYFKNSRDTKNASQDAKVRYELGVHITDNFGNKYYVRLDCVPPGLLNHQSEIFYGINDKYKSSQLYAIDPTTNLDYDNSKHKWNYKKGSNPILMQRLKEWFANHKEFPLQTTSNTNMNNSFYVHFENTNNKTILPKLKPKQRKLLDTSNLVYVRAGGLHSCTITSFNEDDEIYAIDPDQTSFYPWILMSFAKSITTFNGPWYSMNYDLNILLKKLGQKNKREGSKKNVNSISGKIGELLSLLASVTNSTNLLRTGQLENLQMHEILRKMMEHGGHPLSLINGNTDGNLYLTTKEGCEYLQHILDLLFMPGFSSDAIKSAMKEYPEFDKFFDLAKWDEWRKQNKPFYTMLKNTVEVGGVFNRYRQTSVNRYAGVLTNFLEQGIDRKSAKELYEMYDKYCEVDENDNGDDVRKKLVAFYMKNFKNLPADFNLRAISKIVKVKGGWQCWPIIMELEQAKKEGKENDVITDQYNKFGRGPIIDYATISRMLFDGDIKTALTHFNDPLYFCFNAKRTAKYDGSVFESIDGTNKIPLEKVTRYIIAKTKNPALVGNISKYKEYKTQNFDAEDMLDFYANNKLIYKSQVRIQTFANNINNMTKALGINDLCTFNKVGVVRGQGEVYRIDFDFESFKDILNKWDELRKGKKYHKITTTGTKEEYLPTRAKLLSDFGALINEKIDDKNIHLLKDVFSSNLKYFADTKTYQITTSKNSISKVTGSMVCDNSVDEDGFYRGNYIMNEELYDYSVSKDGRLYKNNEPTDVYVDLEFYYNASLYSCWNMQKYFIQAKKNMNHPWILSPEEIRDLITQTDINPSLSGFKKEIETYLKENGLQMPTKQAKYKINEKLILDAEEDDELNYEEEKAYKEERMGKKTQNDDELENDEEYESDVYIPKTKTKEAKKVKVVRDEDIDLEQKNQILARMRNKK